MSRIQTLIVTLAALTGGLIHANPAQARVKPVPYDPNAPVVSKQFVLWGGGQYATFATDLAPELGGFAGVRLSAKGKRRHTQLGLGLMMAKQHGVVAAPDASYRFHLVDNDDRIIYVGPGVQLRFLALDAPDNSYVAFGLSGQAGMWLKPHKKGSVFLETRVTQNIPLFDDAAGIHEALGETAPFNPGSLRTEISALVGIAF